MTTSEPKRLADFSTKLQAALADYSPKRKYLIGVSGGRDSVVLLHALHEWGARHLVVCHLDHGLRGKASQADARFVGRLAEKLGYVFELGEADVFGHAKTQKLSVESAARELRHAFFLSCASTHRCRVVILAHHADDQVETCLFNFLRGTGVSGLSGMKPAAEVNGLKIVRPLLGITREEIIAQAAAHKISHREDKSNNSTAHTRNRLRHDLLPAAEKAVGPSFRAAILRAANILREEESWMASMVPPPTETLSCKALRAMPLALQRRTTLQWLRRHISDPGFAETERVLSLLETTGPAKVNLPGNHHARRRAGVIFLEATP